MKIEAEDTLLLDLLSAISYTAGLPVVAVPTLGRIGVFVALLGLTAAILLRSGPRRPVG